MLDLIRKLVRTLRDLTLFGIVMFYNSRRHGNKTCFCFLMFRWVSLGKFSVAYRVCTTASSCTWIATYWIRLLQSKILYRRQLIPTTQASMSVLFFYRTRENFLTKPVFFLSGSNSNAFNVTVTEIRLKVYIVPELERWLSKLASRPSF